jgi:hypothetical protein
VLFSQDMKTLVCYPPAREGAECAIPAGVTEIGEEAFRAGKNLKRLDIPSGVTTIGDGAFEDCENLAEITIPGTVTRFNAVGNICSFTTGVFEGTGRLRSIAVAEGSADYAAREGVLFSKDMKTLLYYPPARDAPAYEIPAGVTTIGEDAFWWCEKLVSVVMPDSVTTIEDSAFYGCENLVSVTIPGSVTSIGDRVFEDCDDLTVRAGEGSCAAEYARERGIAFEAVPEQMEGDKNV